MDEQMMAMLADPRMREAMIAQLGEVGGGQQQPAPGLLDSLGGEIYDRGTRQWWRQPDRPRVGPFPTSMRETAATPPPTEQRPPGLARLMLQAMSSQGLQIPPTR